MKYRYARSGKISLSISTNVLKGGLGVSTLYCIVFVAPLILFGWDAVYGTAFAVSIVAINLALFLLPHTSSRSNVTGITFIQFNMLALIIVICLSALVAAALAGGIVDRTLARVDQKNFNEGLIQTIISNLAYLYVAILAAMLSWARRHHRHAVQIISLFLACYLLAFSGTRFLFLLTISPLLYSALLHSSNPVKIYTVVVLLLFSTLIAILRSSTSLSIEALLFYDLPSTASYMAIGSYDPKLSDIWYFLAGNVLVLIPRAIFPNKPVDDVTIEFMVSHLGQIAFDRGATYLPGFLGSAWLYGGPFGVLCFSLLLGWILKQAIDFKVYDWKTEAKASLLLVGAVLQFRNISVFYFLPYVYLFFMLAAFSILTRIKFDR